MGGVDTLRFRYGYLGRTKSGRHWIWEALIRLDVGFRRTKSGRDWIWEALVRLDVDTLVN